MERPLPTRLLPAVLLAPPVAPAVYAVGLLAVTLARAAIWRDHLPSAGDLRALFGMSVIVGVPVAYAVTLLVALPVVLWLRHSGRFSLSPVLALGAASGLLTALVLAPQLRSDAYRIPLPWWSGVGMGVLSATVFWAVASRTAARASTLSSFEDAT